MSKPDTIGAVLLARQRVQAIQDVVARHCARESYRLMFGHYPADNFLPGDVYSNPLIVTPNGPPAPVEAP